MDGDELAIAIGCPVVSFIYWGNWYVRALGVVALVESRQRRAILYITQLGCISLFLGILTQLSAKEVRSDPQYVLLFTAVWATALAAVTAWGSILGVRALEDGIERNNPAPLWATAGVWLGATLCSAGANIGEGLTVFTTLFPMSLALGTWAGLWLVFTVVTRNARSIAVERDSASGIRLAGLLIASGLILGRAVAGDWVSTQATIFDFAVQGRPSLVLLGIASVVEFALRPTRRNLFPSIWTAGVVPAFLYVLAASLWFAHLGLIR